MPRRSWHSRVFGWLVFGVYNMSAVRVRLGMMVWWTAVSGRRMRACLVT